MSKKVHNGYFVEDEGRDLGPPPRVTNGTSEMSKVAAESARNAEVIKTLRETVEALRELLRDAHKRWDAERQRADRIQTQMEKLRQMHQGTTVELAKYKATFEALENWGCGS